jgi:hypothetical protein
MKLKLLLFFLFVVSCGIVLQAQTKKPYNNLIITEAKLNRPEFNYAEITNMGTETINLKNFEFSKVDPWTTPFPKNPNNGFMLPDKELAPGKSFVIAIGTDWEPMMWFKNQTKYRERVQKPEMYKLADLILEAGESTPQAADDKVTSYWHVLESWGGRDCLFLRHHYLNETGAKDSMIVDQVNGMFTNANGQRDTSNGESVSVAGVDKATANSVLIRRNSVKTGITEFSSTTANVDAAKLQFGLNKGLDLGDSEWIPVPILGVENDYTLEPWRAVFWTVGNSVDAKLDATTLVSKTGKAKVDFAAGKISIPWGIRDKDSVMFQFKKVPGLAWKYDKAANFEDSAYVSARTGDKLTVYACGDVATIKEFTINVLPPTADDNIVIMKNSYRWHKISYKGQGVWAGMRITDGVAGMDTISYIPYATRVDTLFKYLEKAPKASWKIKFKDGVTKPDLTRGDILSVTSESGKVKDYYLKLRQHFPSNDAYLGAITWPDMPEFFKGDVAKLYGWAGDTIPGFVNSKFDYVVKIPLGYNGIPALVYSKQNLNSKVVVKRAKTLEGTVEDRTATFTVTAESDTIVYKYNIRFEKEKDNANIQPNKAEPFISQFLFNENWSRDWIEIVNPGTEPLDLSHYMIIRGNDMNVFNWWNETTAYSNAYKKYVPGRVWQSEADWQVQPRILVTDLAVNPIVMPGDVFVMTNHGGGGALNYYGKEVDVNFANGKNPWGINLSSNPVSSWYGNVFLYKILNDSVVNGLKPATDINDFELLDIWGQGDWNGWVIAGATRGQLVGYTRKPTIHKGNPVAKASFGTNADDCEWTWVDRAYFTKLGVPWPMDIYKICDGLGSHNMNDITSYRSTVSSKIYKVSPGYSKKETIKGLTTGTTVTGFYNNLIKADEKQTLTVKSVATGKELALADAIAKGDSLIVLSADSTNISKYILDVTANGLSSNALLTSTKYTINVAGTTGTISGIKQRELLKNVFSAVVVPAGATLTITDANDAYMSLTKLNYDSAYVNVIATDKVYFKVLAEDGITQISYQLKPTVNTSDAYVTSDVYSVDQFASLIQFVPAGSSVSAVINNVIPCAGATLQIFDKAGFARTIGNIYKDDKLIVTSADGKVTKAYYFSMLNFNVNKYLAYVISDDYMIDQVKLVIKVPSTGLDIASFFAKLYPSFGAKLSIIDKNGATSTLTKLASYDKLLVTAADNSTTATYKIEFATTVSPIETSIKMYPNPTTDKVVINGLTPGYRVQVFNAVGVTLRDVIVENSTDYVSLSAQPAGVYVFVISSDDKFVNIQKVIKK